MVRRGRKFNDRVLLRYVKENTGKIGLWYEEKWGLFAFRKNCALKSRDRRVEMDDDRPLMSLLLLTQSGSDDTVEDEVMVLINFFMGNYEPNDASPLSTTSSRESAIRFLSESGTYCEEEMRIKVVSDLRYKLSIC